LSAPVDGERQRRPVLIALREGSFVFAAYQALTRLSVRSQVSVNARLGSFLKKETVSQEQKVRRASNPHY
jgi:hypothetical protein